jgi:signal peptidase
VTGTAVGGVVLFITVSTIISGAFGVPMGISYVETNSMSPTLQPDDGFILIPNELAGEPQVGDVVVFDAERIGGGGPTTHRIIKETDRGYITKGDNNNSPDQAGVEPPVQRARIIGHALQFRGHLIVLPYVGAVAQAASGGFDTVERVLDIASWRLSGGSLPSLPPSYLIAGLFILFYLGESIRERYLSDRHATRDRSRKNTRRKDSFHAVLLVFTAVVVLSVTAAMVIPGGSQQYGVVASGAGTPAVVPPGEEVEFSHGLGNSDVLPMTVFLEGGEDVTLGQQQVELDRGGVVNISATVSVPPSVGYHRFYVTEYWYLPILPTQLLAALHDVHPWAPIVVIDAVITIPYYMIGRYFLSRGPPDRDRSRAVA